jgi:tellurite resistance protein
MRALFVALPLFAACASDAIDSDEQARRAYLGLDPSIEKSITLGFAGFNAASSANIPTQMAAGDLTGTIAIDGQVDQGSSANKGMRLAVTMVAYSDGPFEIDPDHDKIQVTYDTDTAPALDMMLKNIPTGTLTGTLAGTYHLSGDLGGDVVLSLTITGALADGGGGTVIRAPGSTTITGTATQGDGVYTVNVTL